LCICLPPKSLPTKSLPKNLDNKKEKEQAKKSATKTIANPYFIPILPGTYCSVIAGYLYGIKYGLAIVFVADFFACSFSFLLSRFFGRDFVGRLLGGRQMHKIENISKRYLEDNFFLMTGLLMTSWFDFVCYAVGLTKISWKKFMPALIFSIIISDIPFVAAGYTLSGFNDVSLKKIFYGEVDIISGNYLFLLIGSAFLVFCLGLLNIFMKNKSKIG
jgi:uncharacterized membrane protein YdjX (TVP38/TMEM64 family)